jgi:hypothetical protein
MGIDTFLEQPGSGPSEEGRDVSRLRARGQQRLRHARTRR